MSGDALGDRMKMYEALNEKKLIPGLPIIVRLDGKSFSKFTKGLERPYDKDMSELMQATAVYLLEATNANIAYTQSDEITLVLHVDNPKSQMYFNGKHSKLVSVLAGMASGFFGSNVANYLPSSHWGRMPIFDCRVWNVPTLAEAANAVLWRERDATKNSIAMAAHHYYSHKELFRKNQGQMQDMLHEKGVNWNDYPPFFKRGSFFQKHVKSKKFTALEIDKLPAKHRARTDPNFEVVRPYTREILMPPFDKVTNRIGVVINGEDPEVENGDG